MKATERNFNLILKLIYPQKTDLVVEGIAVVVVRDELLGVVVADGDDGLQEVHQLSRVRLGGEEKVESVCNSKETLILETNQRLIGR